MELLSFRVQNFRSVNDSGEITVGKLTSLVGRNESGKTNLLLALAALKPASGPKDLSKIKDFPRHRRLSECDDKTPVIDTTWKLSAGEQATLGSLFPRAKPVTHVSIGRGYKAALWVGFVDLPPLPAPTAEAGARLMDIKAALLAAANPDDDRSRRAGDAAATFEAALMADIDAPLWATGATAAATAFRQAIQAAGVALPEREGLLLGEIEKLAASIATDDKANAEARTWAVGLLPVFIYFDDYPELKGHQNIADYLQRKTGNTRTKADINFEKLCKVADLSPEELQALLARNDHETRNQLANRAGAVVTKEIRRLWKDRPLKVRFNPDANHLDTFVSDPNTVYDVEVNLDERSRGFKWFFSFYINFAADTKGGPSENAVLLLDEPGLFLHATSQGDLLRYLGGDLPNQVIYTTHSPFMVPTDNLDAIRTVNVEEDAGTTVSNSPSGDQRTLFPLQAALGFHLAQSLFVGPTNIVIEGVTDYWIYASVSEHFRSIGKAALPDGVTLTPAGGAPKIGYMVALLTSERLKVLTILDDEKQSRMIREEMVKAKLIRDENAMFVTDAFDGKKPNEADVEDLLDPAIYKQLVEESYAKELKGKTLTLNPNIPRIVPRYEQAFEGAGLTFHKTRPARMFLGKMATEPDKVLPPASATKFERLFQEASQRLAKLVRNENEPFG